MSLEVDKATLHALVDRARSARGCASLSAIYEHVVAVYKLGYQRALYETAKVFELREGRDPKEVLQEILQDLYDSADQPSADLDEGWMREPEKGDSP